MLIACTPIRCLQLGLVFYLIIAIRSARLRTRASEGGSEGRSRVFSVAVVAGFVGVVVQAIYSVFA
jgi:uncharacterized membrane protein (DUF485 family)